MVDFEKCHQYSDHCCKQTRSSSIDHSKSRYVIISTYTRLKMSYYNQTQPKGVARIYIFTCYF